MSGTTRFSLGGRTALITGASSGLGARMAMIAAEQGAAVALVGRRLERLESLRAQIASAGGKAIAVPADVTEMAELERAFDATEAAFGTVDLLVANAGMSGRETAIEVTPERWRAIMQLNLDAAFWSAQIAAKRMIAAKKPGAIVTISSAAALVVTAGRVPYSIAKAGLIKATEMMAKEFGPFGIRVNAIAPGFIWTAMTEDFLPTAAGTEFIGKLPLPTYGQPEDLDGAFLLLASEAGRLITGVTLPVDSGATVM